LSNPIFLFVAAAAVLLALAFVILPLVGSRQRATIAVAIVMVPVTTFAIYLWVGTPEGIDPDTGETGQIRSAVTGLAQRALREPDNAEHWARLGLAYKSLEEFSSAEHAFRRALYIDGSTDFIQAELGETLLYASGERQLPEEARSLLLQAAENGNQKALWLLGLDAFQQDNYGAAIDWFERLLAILPGDSNVRATVEQYLATARAEGRDTNTPSRPQTTAGPTLSLSVGIDEGLSERLKGNETVYIIVRRATGGPPLAVRRLRADQLPAELSITDSDAMMAGSSLSSADAVVVVARVSFSGDARPAPGDLEGQSDILRVGSENIHGEVTIEQVL